MSEQIYDQIEQLLYLAIENEISNDQVRTLNNLLVDHPDRIRFAVNYLQISLLLKQSNKVAKMTQDQWADEDFSFDSIEDPTIGSKTCVDSDTSLRGVDLQEFRLDADPEKSDESEITQAVLAILELERISPAVEIEKTEPVKPKRELIQKVERDFKWFPGRPSKFKLRILAAMAACIMVLIGYVHFFAPKDVYRPVVASLADSIDAIWDNEFEIPDKFGDMVQSRYRLKEGFISILFSDGASVTVEAPAELSLYSPSEMKLFAGRIYSTVPNRAKGFAVTAASNKIVDLGTEFGVEVDSGGNTQLHVTKGSTVLFAGLSDGKKNVVQVDAGAAKEVYNDGFVKDIDIAEDKFVRRIDSRQSLVIRRPSFEAIYEPFDYSGSVLNGQSGSNEIGLTGVWKGFVPQTGNPEALTEKSLTYGQLPTIGGSVKTDYAYWAMRPGGSRSIDPDALAGNGLLDNGSTLWFSALIGLGDIPPSSPNKGGTYSLGLALASEPLISQIANPKLETGSGVGIYLTHKSLRAARYSSNGVTKAVESSPEFKVGVHKLVVCKITWGDTDAADDTIEIYMPDTDLVLPSEPVSTLTTKVDQSSFDTLTFTVGNIILIDEIRFGKSYSDVLGRTVTR